MKLRRVLSVVLALWAVGAMAQSPNYVEKEQADAAPSKPVLDLPDNIDRLRQLASEAYYGKRYPRFVAIMEKLRSLRPYNSDYMYQMVLAYALNGQMTPAFNEMLIMQRQGLNYNFDDTPDSESLRTTNLYNYLNDLMIKAGEPLGEGQQVLQLESDIVLPEAIDWDQARGELLIGEVSDGIIWRVGLDGRKREFIKPGVDNGLWSVFDLKVDNGRNHLWVSSALVSWYSGYGAGRVGGSGLFRFDLNSGELQKKYLLPLDGESRALANMTLAGDGTVYVADSVRPVIYKLAPDAQKLTPFLASPALVSIRGMALNADGSKLYLSDYEKGLVVVDLESRAARPLGLVDNLNVGGIDGLYFWDDRYLVAIQNGISPQRLMRFELNDDGTAIRNVRPLMVANPNFDYPNFGAVAGNDMYFFANSHWTRVNARGKPIAGQLPPVKVFKTSLEKGADIISPELEKLKQQMLEQRARAVNQGLDSDAEAADRN